MKTLTLLRGLPGAGKSTLAKALCSLNGDDCEYIEADMYFINDEGEYKFNQRDLPKAHNWCKWHVGVMMSLDRKCIIVANTFTQEWEFQEYHELAKQNGYRIHSLIVENRHGSKSVHDVPDATMGNMLNRFEIRL